jgi:hypothetical protein
MVKKKTSPSPIICTSRGWVLIYVLVFCIIIQGIALVAAGFIAQNLRSGSVFLSLLTGRHAPADAKPALKTALYAAPEGWDHACFLTEVTERVWENQSKFFWRARVGSQPSQAVPELSLSGWRPYIILLVDDSKGMLASSGYAYDEGRTYLERTAGEIVPSRDRDDFTNILTTTEGAYFHGGFGNISKQAVDMYHFGGVTQCWTQAISLLTDLVEDMDMCPMAVATVSKGIVQPFTYDRKALITALGGLRPLNEEAKLSEACLGMTGLFPDACATSRHIIVATTGIAVNDGNIPSPIRDFDNDKNPLDAAVGERSHCLDDVASYARSKGILVHAIGPDSSFLRGVAAKGGGVYLPSKAVFEPPGAFICQMPSLSGTIKRLPVNIDLAFNPGWLTVENASYLRLMANTPPHLASGKSFLPRGVSPALHTSGGKLLCLTSRGDLLSIDMATGACSWMLRGAGGNVRMQGSFIMAGPNIDGDIIALSDGPAVGWAAKGDLFALGRETAYLARGPSISSCKVESGELLTGVELGSPARILEYDPCLDCVVASSGTDLIYILSRDLKILHLLNPDLPSPLDMIRTFTLRKELHVVAVAKNHLTCMTPSKILWKASLESGTCTGAVVMDSKLYLTAFSPGECGGIDSGSSSVIVLDAESGERISHTPLFNAYAFGPLVDLDEGKLEYSSWTMEARSFDIKDLTGIKPSPLGTRLK